MAKRSLSMIRALMRLPHIAWHLGRAGVLGHVAQITLLPSWLRHCCQLLDKAVRSKSAVNDAGGAVQPLAFDADKFEVYQSKI